MTVGLGAVTKGGHAEAIFDGFGAFWGWFSLLDLMIVDWLTLVTEFVGMTAALAIFGVPPWLTVVAVIRSEEHTSELQSHLNLVCRLLLEKKKQIDKRNTSPSRLTP